MRTGDSKRINRLIIIVLLYIGLFCLVFNWLLYGNIHRSLYDFLNSISIVLIVSGVFFAAFDTLNRKLDSLSVNATELSELGIEQIIPYKGKKIDKLFARNDEIKIIINENRLDSIGVILDSIDETAYPHIYMLVIGEIPEKKSQTIDRYHRFFGCNIKILDKSGIDNCVILNHKVCGLNYSGFDDYLSYICVFNGSSEYDFKSRILFQELWNDSETVPYKSYKN